MATKTSGTIRTLAFGLIGLAVLLFGWGQNFCLLWLIHYIDCN
jgi:hypothetical protein